MQSPVWFTNLQVWFPVTICEFINIYECLYVCCFVCKYNKTHMYNPPQSDRHGDLAAVFRCGTSVCVCWVTVSPQTGHTRHTQSWNQCLQAESFTTHTHVTLHHTHSLFSKHRKRRTLHCINLNITLTLINTKPLNLISNCWLVPWTTAGHEYSVYQSVSISCIIIMNHD